MGAVIDFIFTVLLAIASLAIALVLLFCIVEFVVIAVKRLKKEVRKDGGTE